MWNVAVSLEVTDAKNFAALLHKLNMRCLVNLDDVQKGMLVETSFLIQFYLWKKHSQPCILSLLCANKMTS